jgi:short-subunit dehydrogenase
LSVTSIAMKKIIIVGATSGIGRELARIYAGSGNLVGASGRRQELLYSLQMEYPNNVITQCFDATAFDNISHLESLIRKLDGMDLLIYNAGFGQPADDLNWDIDQETTRVNVNGFLDFVNFGYRFFLSQGHGHLVTTSSVASNRGSSFAPAYSASKAFQSTYFEGLHMKLRKQKLPVYVTDIQPGFVDTKMAKAPKKFWVASTQNAARQIYAAVESKKWRAYITRRWWLIAHLMKWMPDFIYQRFG